jgi:hypothetical protein
MLPAIRELQADAEKMGHSLSQHIDYIKVWGGLRPPTQNWTTFYL